jgi:hypothetical protein
VREAEVVVGGGEDGPQVQRPRVVVDRGARVAALVGDDTEQVAQVGVGGDRVHELAVERLGGGQVAGAMQLLGPAQQFLQLRLVQRFHSGCCSCRSRCCSISTW